MADVSIGAPYAPGFVIKDSNNRPITSGITGSMTLYGPSSTTAVSGPTALSHLGAGFWGVVQAGSVHADSGLFKAVTGAITGTATLGPQTMLYTVGVTPPNHRTLGECVADFAIELGDAVEGTATGGSTTTLVDSTRANANLDSSEWLDSELLILEPGAVTDRNPQPVTAFTPASGTFTFPTAVTAITAGVDYLLLNARGRGVTFAKLKRLIVAAWREVSPVQYVADEVNFVTDSTYRLAVPAQWRGIEDVQWRGSASDPWSDIAEAYRPFDPHRRYLNFTQSLASGMQLRVVGTIACAEPDALTSVVQVDYGWLRARVLGQLYAQSESRTDQQLAAVLLADAARAKPRN